MKKALLTLGLCWVCLLAKAQGSGAVYAAPGMPVHLQRGIPTVPARRHAVATVAGAISKPLPPVLARFWHQSDTARFRALQQLGHFTSRQLKYPSNTLRAGIDGIIYARLTIAADGTVSRVDITRRELAAEGGDAAYAEKGKAALDAEMLRVMQQLRFQPSAAGTDTVTIAQKFVMQ